MIQQFNAHILSPGCDLLSMDVSLYFLPLWSADSYLYYAIKYFETVNIYVFSINSC